MDAPLVGSAGVRAPRVLCVIDDQRRTRHDARAMEGPDEVATPQARSSDARSTGGSDVECGAECLGKVVGSHSATLARPPADAFPLSTGRGIRSVGANYRFWGVTLQYAPIEIRGLISMGANDDFTRVER